MGDSSLWFTRHQTCLVPTTMLALRSSALRAARVTAPSRAVAASPRLFASSAPSMKHILSATPADFDELAIKGNRPTLVDFYADWCGPCRVLGPVLEKVVTEESGADLLKIDTEEHGELAAKYKITALPTVVRPPPLGGGSRALRPPRDSAGLADSGRSS